MVSLAGFYLQGHSITDKVLSRIHMLALNVYSYKGDKAGWVSGWMDGWVEGSWVNM